MKSRTVGLWTFATALITGFFTAHSSIAAAPAAPLNTRSAWVDDSAVVLTWDDSADADTFRVYRFDQPSAGWVLVAGDLAAPMLREVPPHAPPVQYAVTAINEDGESAAAIVQVETSGWATTAIMVNQPNEAWGTLTETNAVISFFSSIISGTDGLLEFGTSAEQLQFYAYQPSYEGGHSFLVTDLQPGTEYFYRLTVTEQSRLGLTYVSSFFTIPANVPPSVQDVTVEQIGEWTTSIPLVASNPEPWQPLSARLVTLPTKGNVVALYENGYGNWTALYEPAQGARGTDSFQFVFSDGITDSAVATATITNIYMNESPVAADLQVSAAEDSLIEIGMAATDPDGDPLTYAVTFVSQGFFEISGTNIVLAPPSNFNGVIWITYQVSDGVAFAYGNVEVTVSAVNDAPVGEDVTVSGTEDFELPVALSGTDAEWDQLTYEVLITPEHGTLSGEAPNLIYTPGSNFNGVDSFSYVVSDGISTSEVAVITIEIAAVNDAPVANAQTRSTVYNTPVSFTLTGSDVEGSALSYIVESTPANGTISGTAPNLVFTPATGWSGTTSFNFRVSDGEAESESATVSIFVAAPTSAPIAPNGLVAVPVSSSQINLSWNDASNNEDGFKVERLTNNVWVQVGSVGPNVRTFSSTGLSANKTYQYRVRGYNVLGNSGYSNTASARTLK